MYLPIRITFYILCQIPARRGRVGLEVPILGKPFFPITHCFIFRSNVTLSILSKIVILINFIYFKLECKGCLINIFYEKNFLFRIHFSAVYICLSKVFESCNSSRKEISSWISQVLGASILLDTPILNYSCFRKISTFNLTFFHLKLASCTMHSKTVYFNLFFTAIPYF